MAAPGAGGRYVGSGSSARLVDDAERVTYGRNRTVKVR
jgi:hypothetical protein